jgi:CBS domain-containing protein
MLVRDIMTIYPVFIQEDAVIRRAAEIVSLAQISDIMVLDKDKRFVGVLSEGDLIRALLPNFDDVLAAGGSLDDAFRFFVLKGRSLAEHPITALIIRNPITVQPTDEVTQVATIMIQKQIRRLPVVEGTKLVGTVSRADICRAVIFYAE